MTPLATIDASRPPIRQPGEQDRNIERLCKFLGLEPGDTTTLYDKLVQLSIAVMDKPSPTAYIAKVTNEDGTHKLLVQ